MIPANTITLPADSSLFLKVLPVMVQSRLPRLPSFRNSMSFTSGFSSRSNSGASTPEAKEYVPYGEPLILEELQSEFEYAESEMSSSSGTQTDRGFEGKQATSQSGIAWEYANAGFKLLQSAASSASKIGNGSLTRKMYIDGVTYLLRGLPKDLTAEEQSSIRAACPEEVVQPVIVANAAPGSENVLGTRNRRSLLHRALAATIVQVFLLIQFIRPYLTYLLTTAYQYDRDHRVVRRAVAGSVGTLDKIGQSSMALTTVLFEFGDGQVGRAAAQATLWIIEGVTGGLQEGAEEVMAILARGNKS